MDLGESDESPSGKQKAFAGSLDVGLERLKKEGITRATISEGRILVRADPDASLEALNRQLDKIQEVTKDERVSVYITVPIPSMAGAEAFGDYLARNFTSAGERKLLHAFATDPNANINDALEQLEACGGRKGAFNLLDAFVSTAHASDICHVNISGKTIVVEDPTSCKNTIVQGLFAQIEANAKGSRSACDDGCLNRLLISASDYLNDLEQEIAGCGKGDLACLLPHARNVLTARRAFDVLEDSSLLKEIPGWDTSFHNAGRRLERAMAPYGGMIAVLAGVEMDCGSNPSPSCLAGTKERLLEAHRQRRQESAMIALGLVPIVGEVTGAVDCASAPDLLLCGAAAAGAVPIIGDAAAIAIRAGKAGAKGVKGTGKAAGGGFRDASTWGQPKALADHFTRHGADFGARTAGDYAEMASDFLRRSQTERLPTKIDSKGTVRVYDPNTNTFGAFNPNGTTRTFYKPDPAAHGYSTNLDYWNAQPGVAP